MDVEVAVAASLTVCALAYYNYIHVKNAKQIKKKWRKRRWWMTSIHRNRSRLVYIHQFFMLINNYVQSNLFILFVQDNYGETAE